MHSLSKTDQCFSTCYIIQQQKAEISENWKSNNDVFCNRSLGGHKSQGQLRPRQIKGLAKTMEMFRGRARKRLQISQFPATALVGNPWPCFSRPSLCLSDTFLTAPYCPVGNSGWWVPTPDLRIPCLGHTREMLGSLRLVAFLALVQGLWFLSFSTFSQKTLSTE